MQGAITLASGREIRLRRIWQEHVYTGWLEGVPQRRHNLKIIARYVEQERAASHGHAPYLIEPEQQPMDIHSQMIDADDPPLRLPQLACVARFKSDTPTYHDPYLMDWSELSIIWFQDDFVFPIGAAALAAIQALDWNAHAQDMSF